MAAGAAMTKPSELSLGFAEAGCPPRAEHNGHQHSTKLELIDPIASRLNNSGRGSQKHAHSKLVNVSVPDM